MVKLSKEQKQPQNPNSSTKKKIKKQRKNKNIVHNPSDSESEESNSPSQIQKVIESYTKDQLIEFIITAAVSNPTLYTHIVNAADSDESHRKIFVYGLGWDTSKETLALAFKPFGKIEDCNVVIDKGTGKGKGFGFVLFRTRKGAMKALKEPGKRIGSRMASCQLASMGPGSGSGNGENLSRKIYVSNVLSDTDPERLRVFFSRYGEIEVGPLGFDSSTGKCRGFALFVYRNEEGLRKALEEPYKVFEGHRLFCQKAAGGKNKGNVGQGTVSVPAPVVQQPAPQMLAQFNGMFGQGPMGLNPMYAGMFVNPNGGFIAANPLVAPGVMGQMGGVPGGYYAGAPHGLNFGVGNGSYIGAPPPPAAAQGLGLQHAYPPKKEELGSGSASGSRSQRAGGLYDGYPSRRWKNNAVDTCYGMEDVPVGLLG